MLTAVVREAECIGCSRCIPACPVDAIVGTHNFLHTVLFDECIGCGLCVAPCPVDCIEMQEISVPVDKLARGTKAKQRYQSRQKRLQQEAQRQLPVYTSPEQKQAIIKQEIQAALQRARAKSNATETSI